MAGEIGHVVYAARLMTYLGKRVQRPSYWVGTLFPDIRHLGVVSRYHTHPTDVTLQTLAGKNDFQTGMRVHGWIDAIREQFLQQANIKELLPWHPFVPHALKLVEDELLYNQFPDWHVVTTALETIQEDEFYYVVSSEHLHTWHAVLQHYLAQPPSDASRWKLTTAIGLSAASADEVNTVVARLKRDQNCQKLIKEFWHHLEDLLS